MKCGSRGMRREQCIPLSMRTKECVFDETSPFSGAEWGQRRVGLRTKKEKRK